MTNVKKGEPNNNKGTKPVEVEKIEPNNNEGEPNNNEGMKPVEKIESNDNDAKDNNDPKKLTEDAKSKSEVVDEVKTETESKNEATKPVTEKDNEVTDDKETKTDNNKDDNENKAKTKSEDQEKIRISKSFVAITARPTRERGETRSKYMCRLARQFRNRDRTQPMNDEWNKLTSPTDTSSMGNGSDLEDLTESVM